MSLTFSTLRKQKIKSCLHSEETKKSTWRTKNKQSDMKPNWFIIKQATDFSFVLTSLLRRNLHWQQTNITNRTFPTCGTSFRFCSSLNSVPGTRRAAVVSCYSSENSARARTELRAPGSSTQPHCWRHSSAPCPRVYLFITLLFKINLCLNRCRFKLKYTKYIFFN